MPFKSRSNSRKLLVKNMEAERSKWILGILKRHKWQSLTSLMLEV